MFLKPAAARRFLPFVRDNFPHLASRMDEFYGRHAYAPAAYDDRMRAIFDRLRRRHGFPVSRDPDDPAESGGRSAAAPRPYQLTLVDAAP